MKSLLNKIISIICTPAVISSGIIALAIALASNAIGDMIDDIFSKQNANTEITFNNK